MKKGLVLSCLCVLACVAPARGDFEAFTKARHSLKLGITVPGKITKLPIEPGQRVKQGDLLLELEDLEGEAQIDILKMQAASNVAVESAKAQLEMSQFELKKVDKMYVDNIGGSLVEVERAKIQVRIAKLKHEQAALEHELLELQLKQALARHERYKLKAPMDGLIEEVAVSKGETVEQLTPIIALVVTDTLRADTPVPTSETLGLKVGDAAYVRINLPGFEDKVVTGKIIFMGQVVDAASDTRLVRIEMPNNDNLPAGVQVQVSFNKPDEMASLKK